MSAKKLTKAAKPKKYKVTIICKDTEKDTMEMEIKFSPHIPGGETVKSAAVATATDFIKFIGERYTAG